MWMPGASDADANIRGSIFTSFRYGSYTCATAEWIVSKWMIPWGASSNVLREQNILENKLPIEVKLVLCVKKYLILTKDIFRAFCLDKKAVPKKSKEFIGINRPEKPRSCWAGKERKTYCGHNKPKVYKPQESVESSYRKSELRVSVYLTLVTQFVIPASSAPAERDCSLVGLVIRERRFSRNPVIVDDIVSRQQPREVKRCECVRFFPLSWQLASCCEVCGSKHAVSGSC